MFTRTALQWLMYKNRDTETFVGSHKSAAPRGIDALFTFIEDWKMPVVIGAEGRSLTEQEWSFLRDVRGLRQAGGDFAASMRDIVDHYPVTDHFGKPLDRATVVRLQKAPRITDMLNGFFQNVPMQDIEPENSRKLISRIFDLLGVSNNAKTILLAAAERHHMFHSTTRAVDWSSVIRDVMYGDIDDAVDAMRHADEENRYRRDRFEAGTMRGLAVHAGTMMAG